MYCDALVFSNRFNAETRNELDKTWRAARSGPLGKKANMVFVVVKLRCHLALVLQQMGIDEAEQNEYVFPPVIYLSSSHSRHVEYCTKYLRKNPKAVSEGTLLQFLFRQNQPEHPVLTALGGVRWLEGIFTREGLSARMEERLSKQCRQCGVREPEKTLSRCSGCKHIFYWYVHSLLFLVFSWYRYCLRSSRECQKANWRLHK